MFQQGDDPDRSHAEAKSEKHLSARSAEELHAELDEIFEKEARTGIQTDPELVAEYVSALEDRGGEGAPPAQTNDDFERAWARFTDDHPELFPPARTRSRSWGRRACRFAAAAALAVTVLAATAAAFHWPDYIVEWGRELLRIAPAPSGVMELAEPNADGYSTLAEAVAGAGMDEARVPAWIPSRFAIKDLAIQELSSYTITTGIYGTDKSELAIRISYYPEAEDIPYFNFETNNDEQSEVTQDGVTYYYTENFETLRVTWKDGKCLYSIAGKVTREEMERMVNSFYGG